MTAKVQGKTFLWVCELFKKHSTVRVCANSYMFVHFFWKTIAAVSCWDTQTPGHMLWFWALYFHSSYKVLRVIIFYTKQMNKHICAPSWHLAKEIGTKGKKGEDKKASVYFQVALLCIVKIFSKIVAKCN